MKFLKPTQLGSLTIPNNVFYSPLAGCSDQSYRSMARKYGAGLVFCEMVKMDALIRHDPNTYRILEYDAGQHPIGAQLVGSKANIAGQSARILEDLGFDVIDLNCGCPVDKVTKDASGSGLLLHLELIEEILTEMIHAVSIPVTVKIRAGWDENTIVAPEITQIAERVGAKIIFIHGRTRKQAYKGPADWEVIKECKKRAKSILVFGNGDVFSPEAAQQMFETTGCDGVLVSRGTLGKPWIAEDIIRHLQTKAPILRSGHFIYENVLEHMEKIIATEPPRKALTDIRRVGCWYLKDAPNAKQLRNQLNKMKSLDELAPILNAFAWDSLTPNVQ